ncbi:hypothetical protein EUTSA_v10000813mg [Eutrema salsugineum]|uniref:Phorbol-ester/DAG-type domain-containing protein n=1 Tax=Eutrema salsugineum TaxID=72664 RepID=V4L7Z1_EUTSA|nr:hypothetical protein EUTSA_v10000813mg [Eutrema salsugineum]
MEEKIINFSSRADLVCRLLSDSAQPVHYLSRNYGSFKSKCFICDVYGRNFSKYYLHCDACNLDVHKNCYLQPRCRFSTLTKPHTLQKVPGDFVFCSGCQKPCHGRRMHHYHCPTCNVDFHKDCHLYPPEITHPFHPLHPLKFIFPPGYSYSDLHKSITLPSKWLRETSDSEAQVDKSDDASISEVKCKCCQIHLKVVYYHCSICNFSLNLTCTRKPPPLTILNLKNHQHTLTIFPRRVPLPCDACGESLSNTQDHVYTCHPCGYMVHRTCIYLPRVIKITRHPHRLSLSSSLPSGLLRCGVCRHTINGCQYAIHSRCAVKGNVWDGEDLEGVAEEPDEDLESFVRIDDETIQHFSHDHHLRLHENNKICDENRFCQACILPIMISESFYSCMQCDFLLHEACASLPRKKDHPLHKHPLILHPIAPEPTEDVWEDWDSNISLFIHGMFKCNGCGQRGYGFVYKCSKEDCKFQLDIRCASLPDPVIHGSHPHDLFFNLSQGECMGCKSSKCSPFSLECIESKSFLGLKCATLPSITHYKHDKHPLTLCYGEEDTTSGQSWCEICEAKLDVKQWFYKCDEYCSVKVHISCLLGEERFMKPTSLRMNGGWVSFIRNNSNTRAICIHCKRRCTEPFLHKRQYSYEYSVCSLRCLLG